MKKIMMIAAMMVATLGAVAQNEVGQLTLQPKVGMNISKITGSNLNSKVGLVAGFEAEYGVAKNFGVSVAALYSMQGAKRDLKAGGTSVDVKFNLDYINIPVLAQYYIVPGLAVKAGIQFGFNVRNKVKVGTTVAGYNLKDDCSMDEFLDVARALGEPIPSDAKFQKFDLSIPVGLSYEYEDFVLDARYNIGTSKLIKSDPDSSKNGVFQLTIGYKFEL